MSEIDKTYVQFGCGWCAPPNWVNFDSSPTLRLERLPLLGGLVRKNADPFPPNVRYGDIVAGLPVPAASVDGLYSSHVLEHLNRQDFDIAIRNCFRMLKPAGIFRLVVPDLEYRARSYVKQLETGERTANDWFLRHTMLGVERSPSTLMEWAGHIFGGSKHLWMWDYPSLSRVLSELGFTSIRRCEFNDSTDPAFRYVEDLPRFIDGEIRELAVEAVKPGN